MSLVFYVKGVNLSKVGIRVLGISESFRRGSDKSVLCGVVMTGELKIDGIALSSITVGGTDATQGILRLYDRLDRSDIHFLLLNGCVISWFNVIDLDVLYQELCLPVICMTYEESDGLETYFREYFEDFELRLEMYNRMDNRRMVKLKTGFDVYLRMRGCTLKEGQVLINRFITHGKVPEPLRIAKLMARAVLRTGGK